MAELEELCPACAPYPIPLNHPADRWLRAFDFYLPLVTPASRRVRDLILTIPLDRWFLRGLIEFLLQTKLLVRRPLERDQVLNRRTAVILEAAKKRGLQIDWLQLPGRPSNLFALDLPDRPPIYFEGLPTVTVDQRSRFEFDDKLVFKQFLTRHSFLAPTGRAFRSIRSAIAYGQQLGFPLVVKPRHGSLSRHTTVNIQTPAELNEAIRSARVMEREWLVEQFLPGKVFRVTLVGGELVAACWREASHVVGDGQLTLIELVEAKNRDPRRGAVTDTTRTLHWLTIPANLDPAQLPRAGEKISLSDKVTLAAGADIHDVTDMIHHTIKDLLEDLARKVQIPVLGLDLIAEDVAQPWQAQSFGIIEANSLPHIDMHHVPVTGQVRDVAGAILDYMIHSSFT